MATSGGWYCCRAVLIRPETVGQSTTEILSQYRQFTNIAVGLIALLGVGLAARKRSCVFCRIPPTTTLIASLYVYAFVTISWAPDSLASLEQWRIQGPYIITIALLAPLLFTDLDDARAGLTLTIFAGAAICVLALAFGNWGPRGLVLYGHEATQEYEANPLALSSMAGTVFLISALSLGRPNRIFMRIVATVCIPISLAVVLRSGSRGQFIASGAGLIVALPIAFRLRNIQSIATLLLAAIAVVGLGWWTTSFVDIDSSRWSESQSSADVIGRFANAQVLLQASSSHLFTAIFGLGNSSSFQVLGIYPHISCLEVLAEEGFVGAAIYLAIILFAVRSIKRIVDQPGLSDSKRNALAILTGLFLFELVLSWKQGSLLSSVYVFLYAITLARLEQPAVTNLSVSDQIRSGPSIPRFPNLLR